jgi:hypothetical protein
MAEESPNAGLLIAALGAVILAISVFLPWWSVSLTQTGAYALQQNIQSVAQQYGNTSFQTLVTEHEGDFSALAGRQLATVSAHRILKRGSEILLVLAGLALLASFLRIADMRGIFFATGSQIALLGGLAFAYVFFRILWAPAASTPGYLSLSLSWGILLALVSAAAILGGGLAAGSNRTRRHVAPKQGPGPPPINRDVASPLAMFQERH